jgi:hypothetical protein
MTLLKSIKPELENKFKIFLDKASLKRYLNYYNGLDLANEIDFDQGLEQVYFEFIFRAEKHGYLIGFLQYLEAEHPNSEFTLWLQETLAAVMAPVAPITLAAAAPEGTPARPHQVHGNWVVNRSAFWAQLCNQVTAGVIRTMVVTGGTGKSHSRWLVGHASESAANSRYAWIPLNTSAEAKVDASALAGMIATQLWGMEGQKEVDYYTTDARKATSLPGLIVNRLANMNVMVWLVLDDLNRVRLEETGRTFIQTLFDAVNSPQCKNVRLFLLGIDNTQFPAGLGNSVQSDHVCRPTLHDIDDLVGRVADTCQAVITANQRQTITSALDGILPATPSQNDWKRFHDQVNALEKSFRN